MKRGGAGPLVVPLVAVVALAVGLRLLVFTVLSGEPRKFYTPDSSGYQQRAVNLLDHHVFSGRREPPYTPDVGRTPGYPVLMAAIFAVAGPRPEPVVLAQIGLSGLTAALTLALAAGLGLTARAALVAGVIVAVEPVSTLTANLLLTETLFTTLLVLGLVGLARYWRAEDWRWLPPAALALALASLTRPVGQLLPVALLPLFGVAPAGWSWRRVTRVGVPFVLGSLLLLLPWVARNHREAGLPALSSIDAGVLYWSWTPVIVAGARGTSVAAERNRLVVASQARALVEQLPVAEQVRRNRQNALDVIRRYPGSTLLAMGTSLVRLLADPGYTLICTLLDPGNVGWECFPGENTMNESGLVGRAWARFLEMRLVQQAMLGGGVLLLAVTYLAAAAGLWGLARRRRWRPFGLLGIVIGYFVVLSAGPPAEGRFRVPIMPALAIAAGAGCHRLRHKGPGRPSTSPEARAVTGAAPPFPRQSA